jgi:hypothetical protein
MCARVSSRDVLKHTALALLTLLPIAPLCGVCRIRRAQRPYDVSNQVQMCINGETGRTYMVEASPDLVNWTLIAAPLNSDGTLRFADPARDNYRQCYYRVMFEP